MLPSRAKRQKNIACHTFNHLCYCFFDSQNAIQPLLFVIRKTGSLICINEINLYNLKSGFISSFLKRRKYVIIALTF